MHIRTETVQDSEAISAVNDAAFGRDAEGSLVAALRRAGGLTLSLVAEREGRVVGHIAFSPGRVVGHAIEREAVGLGPLAVHPDFQGQGIGSRLVREGLQRLQGGAAIFLLGHPRYYPRFGFVPAHRFGVRCEFEADPQHFMVWAPGGVAPAGLEDGGVFYYRPEFRGV